MRRIAVAIALAVSAAVAIGALHGGAATPSTQSVAVPDKSGQTVSVAWSGTIVYAYRFLQTERQALVMAALRPALEGREPCCSLLVTEEISNTGCANKSAPKTKSREIRNRRIRPERNIEKNCNAKNSS